jgi:hypothetical protein
MKAFLFLLLILPASATASPSTRDSGTSIGNGGHSISCRQPDGTVTKEAFDLFEGRALFGYRVAFPETVPAAELALQLAAKVDKSQGGAMEELDTVRGKVKFIRDHMVLLPPGVGLKPTEDSNEFIVPRNCEIIQTINFRQNRRIYVDSDAWNALTETSKAALFLHEAIYWQLREGGEEHDSRRTRRLVSYLMSGGELAPRARVPLPTGSQAQYCHSVEENSRMDWNTKLFAYKHEGRIVLQFLQIGGYRLLGRTELSSTAHPNTPAQPLTRDASRLQRMQGWIGSPPDTEAYITLIWGQGRIDIEGYVQQGVRFADRLECHNWTLSW